MRFDREATPGRLVEIDITSMIDVVFLLIVFFMTTAQFSRMTKAEVQLPREQGESGAERTELTGVIINVMANGSYVVEGQTVDQDRLVRMLDATFGKASSRNEQPKPSDVVLRADKRAPAAAINAIAERLVSIGVRSWTLSTEPPFPGGAP